MSFAEYYVAVFPYTSPEAGDLNFNQGEVILVIKKEGEWWTGMIADKTGIFPSNYVQKADTQVNVEVFVHLTNIPNSLIVMVFAHLK